MRARRILLLTAVLVALCGAESAMAEQTRAEQAKPAKDLPATGAVDRKSKASRYTAPPGLGKYTWSTPLSTFDTRLKPEPLYAQMAYSKGKATGSMPHTSVRCEPARLEANPGQGGEEVCHLDTQALAAYEGQREGEGGYALAEYKIPEQGFILSTAKVAIHPVTYMFCANWHGAEPKTLQDQLKLCGVRMYFKTEDEAELTAVDDDVLTGYERVLDWLRAEYGDPKGYTPNGRVIIRTPNEIIVPPRERRFARWQWCGARSGDIKPSCAASIVLTADLQTGIGLVVYATPSAFEFAYARRESGIDDDPMYRLLFDAVSGPSDRACTGTRICGRAGPTVDMSQDQLNKFKANTQASDSVPAGAN